MTDADAPALARLPEDWERALAVVAHPDDMEYGAASAVSRWTSQGKDVRYVLVTDGEAGIATMPPERAGPLRRAEQKASCAEVGVETVEFLGHPDGLVVADRTLRADLTDVIRRHRPEAVISINFRDSWGGPSWNHVDHRAVGTALLDAVRDAANPWLFTDRGDPWAGVQLVAFNASPQSTHAVDVTDFLDDGIRSLACHRTYLDNLSGTTDPDAFLRRAAADMGLLIGVEYAVTFEVVRP
jgi:LmbE family N-acetylglucosaminyl deacetylase